LILSWGSDCEGWELDGDFTQPVFNELARFDPNRLSDTSALSQSLPLCDRNQTNCLSGARLNFHVRPRLTFGTSRHWQFTKSSFVADHNKRK